MSHVGGEINRREVVLESWAGLLHGAIERRFPECGELLA